MSRFFTMKSVTALSLLSLASPAWADLNPDDAWTVWKSQFEALGLAMSADETRDGDALQIDNLRLSVTFPQDEGFGWLELSTMRFEGNGDGSVSVVFPESLAIQIGGDAKEEGNFIADLEFSGINPSTRMSGTPDLVITDWSGDGYEVKLVDVTIGGENAIDAFGTVKIGAASGQNTTEFTATEVLVSQTFNYADQETRYGFSIPGEDFGLSTGNTGKDMSGALNLRLPKSGIDPFNLHNQLRAGMQLALNVSAASSSSSQTVKQGDKVLSSQRSSGQNFAFTGGVDSSGLTYELSGEAFDLGLEMAEIPFPMSAKANAIDFLLKMPLLKEDTAQPAAFRLSLEQLSVDEGLWALIDPASQLPHTPVDLTLDMDGGLKLTLDLLDFASVAAYKGANPVLIESLKLKQLLVSAVGARLTGDGAFSFDNSDMASFGGVPRPEGNANLLLEGGNAVLDKLIAMGFVSENDAMGARMMMGMFMVPGDGPDTLRTTIEITPEGHVLANGQRIK